MCDVKRNSGLALLAAGAIGSGGGLFLCIALLVCREEGRRVLEHPHPTSCRRCYLCRHSSSLLSCSFAGSEARLAESSLGSLSPV